MSKFMCGARRSSRWLCLVYAAAGVSITLTAVAAPASLCRQLADRVEAAASSSVTGSLDSWISTAASVDPRHGWGPREQAANSLLRHALVSQGLMGDEGDFDSVMELVRLPGADLYMGNHVAGSAECQSLVFAQASPDGQVRRLPNPDGYTAPCWSVVGSLATVLGVPAYVEQGALDLTTADTTIRITPWTGQAWGPVCALAIELNYQLELGQRFCRDRKLCGVAEPLAFDVARRYLRFREDPSPPQRSIGAGVQVPEFRYPHDQAADADAWRGVADAWHALVAPHAADTPGEPPMYTLFTSEFPTFGVRVPNGGWETSFSYVEFALFPLELQGRPYLGAVGHNGAGWREGSRVLFAVYEWPRDDRRVLVPLAGFSVNHVPHGVKRVVVSEGAAALPARPAR